MLKLSDNVYNILKEICLIGIPATSTLLISLTDIWGLPIPAQQIAATLAAIGTALGALLKISTAEYYQTKSEDETPEEETKVL